MMGRHQRIDSFTIKDNYIIDAVFQNGERRYYDVKPLVKRDMFSAFCDNPALFRMAKLIHSGLAIAWSDEVDIASDEIYYNGAGIPTPELL